MAFSSARDPVLFSLVVPQSMVPFPRLLSKMVAIAPAIVSTVQLAEWTKSEEKEMLPLRALPRRSTTYFNVHIIDWNLVPWQSLAGRETAEAKFQGRGYITNISTEWENGH